MTLNTSFYELAEAVRKYVGTNNPLSVSDMTDSLNKHIFTSNIMSPMPQMRYDLGNGKDHILSNANDDGSQTFDLSSHKFTGNTLDLVNPLLVKVHKGDRITEFITVKGDGFQDITANFAYPGIKSYPTTRQSFISTGKICIISYVFDAPTDGNVQLFCFWSNYNKDSVTFYNPKVFIDSVGGAELSLCCFIFNPISIIGGMQYEFS